MFLNEAQVVDAVGHPNILRIYDVGNYKGWPYLAMEYVEGLRTLGPCCKPDELLPTESVIRLVQQCAKVLDHAHRNDVTHRDIKPDSIMLTVDDEVNIVDFGVAEHKHRRSDDSLPRLNPVSRTFSSSSFSVNLGEPLSMSNAIENATMRSLAAA
jgi:serine/threonine protein kinase